MYEINNINFKWFYSLLTILPFSLAAFDVQKAALFQASFNHVADVAHSGDYRFDKLNTIALNLCKLKQAQANTISLSPQSIPLTDIPQVLTFSSSPVSSISASESAHFLPQNIGAAGKKINSFQVKTNNKQWVNNCLRKYGQHSIAIFNARKHIIHHEIKHATSVLRQFDHMHLSSMQSQNICKTLQNLKQLGDLTISVPPLNNLLKKTIHNIQKQVTDEKGSYKPYTTDKASSKSIFSYDYWFGETIESIINKFEKKALDWLEDTEWYFAKNDISADYQCLSDTEKFINFHKDVNAAWYNDARFAEYSGNWDFLNNAQTLSSDPCHTELQTKIINNKQNEKLLALDQLCVSGNLQEARKLAHNSGSEIFNQIYCHYFKEHCNEYGIYKTFERDPKYNEILKNIPASTFQKTRDLPTLHKANELLAQRAQILQTFIQKLNICQTTPEIEKILYTWVDEYQKNDLKTFSLFQASQLSSDHPNLLMRDWYNALYAHGLPRDFVYNEPANQITMPEAIGTCVHTKERQLLFELATCPMNSEQSKEYIVCALEHLKAGLTQTPEAQFHKIIAHEYCKALFDPHSERHILTLSNYSPSRALPIHQQTIQNAAVKLIAQNINATKTDQLACSKQIGSQTITRVDNAYRAMLDGNLQAEDYLDRALLSEVNLNVLSIDFDKQAEFYKTVGLESAVQRKDQIQSIIKSLDKCNMEHSWKEYEISPALQQFLIDHNLTIDNYKRLYGNQLQHAMHVNTLNLIQKEHELLTPHVIKNSALHDFANLTVPMTDLSRAYNKVGDVLQSSMISNFCWQMIDYIEKSCSLLENTSVAIIRGAGLATLDKAQNLYQIGTHPIDSFKNIITSLGNLGQTALKLVDQIDRTLGNITSRDEVTRIKTLIEINKCNEALLNTVIKFAKEEGLPGVAEKIAYHGTSLVLDTALITKSIHLLNKFATIATSDKMGKFVREVANATTKAPEVEAITAEGAVVKIPQSTEICTLNETQKVTRQHRSISDTIAPIAENCPASCTTQYEKLKNALKIEEFTSIAGCTEHGLQRLIERGFDASEVLSLLSKPDYIRIQSDGAKVFIQKLENKFRIIIFNESTGEIVTALKETTEKKIISLGKNYGWEL